MYRWALYSGEIFVFLGATLDVTETPFAKTPLFLVPEQPPTARFVEVVDLRPLQDGGKFPDLRLRGCMGWSPTEYFDEYARSISQRGFGSHCWCHAF